MFELSSVCALVLALFQRNKNEKKATTNCSGPALDGFAIRDHDLPADTMGHEHKGSQASITLQCRGHWNTFRPWKSPVFRAINSRRRRLQDRNRPAQMEIVKSDYVDRRDRAESMMCTWFGSGTCHVSPQNCKNDKSQALCSCSRIKRKADVFNLKAFPSLRNPCFLTMMPTCVCAIFACILIWAFI